mmetsp:Transcript_132921/g.265252  ORF Transcript_132921/g.265252 Transcript_132921/m.265252 type:complete len:225 (+) Transcript_132921:636-1310(+)
MMSDLHRHLLVLEALQVAAAGRNPKPPAPMPLGFGSQGRSRPHEGNKVAGVSSHPCSNPPNGVVTGSQHSTMELPAKSAVVDQSCRLKDHGLAVVGAWVAVKARKMLHSSSDGQRLLLMLAAVASLGVRCRWQRCFAGWVQRCMLFMPLRHNRRCSSFLRCQEGTMRLAMSWTLLACATLSLLTTSVQSRSSSRCGGWNHAVWKGWSIILRHFGTCGRMLSWVT